MALLTLLATITIGIIRLRNLFAVVVLGGIYETERRETISKVPWLGDIPGLGVLFRSTTTRSEEHTSELQSH